MDLQNYTNIDIFKKTYEQRQVVEGADMIAHSHNHLGAAKEGDGYVKRAWEPYTNNMGTTVGKYLKLFEIMIGGCRPGVVY